MDNFSRLSFVDLHRNVTAQEDSPNGIDENVFDIEQGAGVSLIRLNKNHSGCEVLIGDVWGSRAQKYKTLDNKKAADLGCKISPVGNLFLFSVSGSSDTASEYNGWPSAVAVMPNVMGPNGTPQSGLATMHDAFAVGFTEEDLKGHIKEFLSTESRSQAVLKFGAMCNVGQWSYDAAKSFLSDSRNWKSKIATLSFAPMDRRYTIYDRNVAVHLRKKLSDHLYKRDNLALITSSAGQEVSGGEWDGVFCTREILQLNFFPAMAVPPSRCTVMTAFRLREEGRISPPPSQPASPRYPT